jgi:hypothetical protein
LTPMPTIEESIDEAFLPGNVSFSVHFISATPQFGSAHMRGKQVIKEINSQLGRAMHLRQPLVGGVHTCGASPCSDICIFVGPCGIDQFQTDSACCGLKVLDMVDKYCMRRIKFFSCFRIWMDSLSTAAT